MKLVRSAWAITLLVSLPISQPVVAQTGNNSVRNLTSKALHNAPHPGEGIKVHGFWTIVIRNRDGSVVSRREFENRLVLSGQAFLSMLLSHKVPQFSWFIQIEDLLCGKTTTGGGVPCYLAESNLANTPPSNPATFQEGMTPGLSVSVPTTGQNSGRTIVLSGNLNATYAGQISHVDTATVIQGGSDGIVFTMANLSPAINVQAGQTINLTVVISYS